MFPIHGVRRQPRSSILRIWTIRSISRLGMRHSWPASQLNDEIRFVIVLGTKRHSMLAYIRVALSFLLEAPPLATELCPAAAFTSNSLCFIGSGSRRARQ